MKYFVEVKTVRSDGHEVTWREKAKNYEDARTRSIEIAAAAVFDHLKELKFIDNGQRIGFLNDYGGYSVVGPISYGEQAQVREGVFIL